MFSYSTGDYVSPPVDQYLKFKNRCSLLYTVQYTVQMQKFDQCVWRMEAFSDEERLQDFFSSSLSKVK